MIHTKTLIIALLASAQALFAQSPATEAIPSDSKTIIGRLENGMTYYIRPNASKEGKADFHIVHNVGALQEEDNQNGLAHFLEHMAFNGTRHFPDKQIFPFLASEGVRFGYNINAYTSRYETVYYLTSVPLVRESFTDSVLTVIRDWSCDISCEGPALDAERGVISEEWRRRDDTRTRMALKQNALLYKGSKHTERTVLGTLEVINGFKRSEILDFYHKWYRPDLQAVIATGDFDPAYMEELIKKKFGDIPAAVNPEPKPTFRPVPIESPLFENMTDPEIQYYVLKVFHRQTFPNEEQRRGSYWMKDLLCRSIVTAIMDERLKEQSKKADSRVRSAVVVTGVNNVEFYSTQFTITPKKIEELEEALSFYETNMRRLLEHGVSEQEIEAARYKVECKYKLDEEVYENKLTAREIADACKEHFLRAYPCIYTGEKNRLMKEVLSEINAEDISAAIKAMFIDSEKIYSYSVNEKKMSLIPSKERMECIIDSVAHTRIEAEYTNYKSIDLSLDVPECKIVRTQRKKDGEIWTLDNGVKVYWTPSDEVESNFHLSMRFVFASGFDALDEKGSARERFAISYLDRYGGLCGIDRLSLKGLPQGAGIRLTVGEDHDCSNLTITSDKANIDKAFRIAVLQLSKPYFGSDKTLEQHKSNSIASLKKEITPYNRYKYKVKLALCDSALYARKIEIEDVKNSDMALVKRVWEQSFSGNAQVFVCSDMSREEARALVCRYFGALPQRAEIAKTKPFVPDFKKNIVMEDNQVKTSAPKSEITFRFRGKADLTQKELLSFSILDHIMSTRYLNLIREERGGTYHISFDSEIFPEGRYFESIVQFQTRPEMKDLLVQDVIDELGRVTRDGVRAEEFDEAVKYLRKYRSEKQDMKNNSVHYKNTQREYKVRYGMDADYDIEKLIHKISLEDIRKLAVKVQKSSTIRTIYNEL